MVTYVESLGAGSLTVLPAVRQNRKDDDSSVLASTMLLVLEKSARRANGKSPEQWATSVKSSKSRTSCIAIDTGYK